MVDNQVNKLMRRRNLPARGTVGQDKGRVKELVGPRLGDDAGILRPKEGSNGHKGREVCNEVPAHNWHLRQFGSRFRKGKEPVSRIEEVVRNVVQGSHLEFTQALPSRNFGK